MASIQTNIRIKKAYQRLNKTVYPTCKVKKDVIKKHEATERLSREIDTQWRIIYAKGFVAGKDNSNPAFYDDFDLLQLLLDEQTKIYKSLNRKVEKYELDLDAILKDFRQLNTGRLSQSY